MTFTSAGPHLKRLRFTRETLDATQGQETAFAGAIEEASDGEIVKVVEDE